MGVNHPGLQLSLDELIRIVRREAVATIQNASIGRAGLRVYDGGSITIQGGGLFVTGTESVSGLLSVTGRLLGSGELVWSGPWELSGPGDITGRVGIDGNLTVNGTSGFVGPMTVAGTLGVTGAASFANTLRIAGTTTLAALLDVIGGRIRAGNMVFDGTNGGTIASSATLNLLGQIVNLGGVLTQAGLFKAARVETAILEVTGAKNFKIPHPTRVDHVLRHASTESPVSGVEYCGTAHLDEQGEAVVELPEYFEALTELDGRTAHLTAIGRPFATGYDPISDGRMTVYGEANREVSWLVKAARKADHGGHFETEEPVFGPLRQEAS